jgi:hypothetical protein
MAASLAASAAAQGSGPAISLEPAFLDLGVLEHYQQETRNVVISNIGDDVLRIDRIESTCGCTVAELENDVLEPGEQTTLTVTFDSQKFEGPQAKSIVIFSNDPASPELEYEILADVHVPVLVDPPTKRVFFGTVRRQQDSAELVVFTSPDVPQLQVTPSRYNEELFSFETVNPYEGDPQKVLLVVRIKPEAPTGNHREFIRVETNVAEMPTVDLEAIANVVQDLCTDLDRIGFRYVERDEIMTQTVKVRPMAEDIAFKVTGAEIDLPNFEARVEEVVPNKDVRVHISGRPLPTSDPRARAAQGRMVGTLRIFTDLPTQPELTIRVSYLLKL